MLKRLAFILVATAIGSALLSPAPASAALTSGRTITAVGTAESAPLPGTGFQAATFHCEAAASGIGLYGLTIDNCVLYAGGYAVAGSSSNGTVTPDGAGVATYVGTAIEQSLNFYVCWHATAYFSTVSVRTTLIAGAETRATSGCSSALVSPPPAA
jgi:hypothetical protein